MRWQKRSGKTGRQKGKGKCSEGWGNQGGGGRGGESCWGKGCGKGGYVSAANNGIGGWGTPEPGVFKLKGLGKRKPKENRNQDGTTFPMHTKTTKPSGRIALCHCTILSG